MFPRFSRSRDLSSPGFSFLPSCSQFPHNPGPYTRNARRSRTKARTQSNRYAVAGGRSRVGARELAGRDPLRATDARGRPFQTLVIFTGSAGLSYENVGARIFDTLRGWINREKIIRAVRAELFPRGTPVDARSGCGISRRSRGSSASEIHACRRRLQEIPLCSFDPGRFQRCFARVHSIRHRGNSAERSYRRAQHWRVIEKSHS